MNLTKKKVQKLKFMSRKDFALKPFIQEKFALAESSIAAMMNDERAYFQHES
jgi:hypothetical protein